MDIIDLINKAKKHYSQLAPHIKQRETAILFKELLDSVERLQYQANIPKNCQIDTVEKHEEMATLEVVKYREEKNDIN